MHKLPIKILIVDDHKLIRDGVKQLLMHQNEMVVETHEALDGKEAIACIKKNHFDLVLLDISLPQCDGIETIKILKEYFNTPPIIVLTMHDEISYIRKAFINGVQGYLFKNCSQNEIIKAITIVLEGKRYFNNDVSNLLFDDLQLFATNQQTFLNNTLLSKREVQIISLYVKGLNSAKIATLLNISKRTIEGHRTNIFKKLNVRSIKEMIVFGLDNGFK